MRVTTTCALLAAALTVADGAHAAAPNGGIRSAAAHGEPVAAGGGDCCVVHANPGCADNAVEACVCALDPFCCTVEWDSACVARVELFGCGTCDVGPACCTPETVGGCPDDAFIETCVCTLDPFCCNNEWDNFCVQEVVSFGCGTCGGSLVHNGCAGSIDINRDGSRLFTTVGATTDGPAWPASCGSGNIQNDVWYCYTPECGGQVTASSCLSQFDTRIAVYQGCQCPATNDRLLACNDNSCATQSSVTFATTAGQSYLIRVGSTSGTGLGLLTISGGGTTNTDDCNDNGTADGCDVSVGGADDCGGNGVPDECDIDFGRSVLLQLPDQANGLFADANCGQCTTLAQSAAEQFVLTQPRTIERIRIWGGYAPGNNSGPGDNFTVVFHDGAPLTPGVVILAQSNVPSTRTQTGGTLFGLTEWEYLLTLPTPVTLNAGAYYVQIYNNTTGTPDSFFWETGVTDAVSGLAGHSYADETPGVAWTFDGTRGFAMQVLATRPFDCDEDAVIDECDPDGGVIEGDIDHDCDRDLTDHTLFVLCSTGPGGGVVPVCEPADMDNDNDVDLIDWRLFQAAFDLP